MTWSSRRQAIIISALLIVIILLLIPAAKPVFFSKATCSDNKQNQGEKGVDCGGPCLKVCPFEAVRININWVRPFEVAPGVYSAVAYISNPNAYFEAKNVSYVVKVYDERHILLAERNGSTDIPAKSAFPVFEGGIVVGKLKVQQASFEFTGEPNWQRTLKAASKINVTSPIVQTEGTPAITATIRNDTSDLLKNLPVVAIVFDEEGNAMAASQTVVDRLAKNESTSVSFTWLSPFQGKISRVEIYPHVSN